MKSLALAVLALACTGSAAMAEQARKVSIAPPPEFDVPYTGKLTIWRTRSEQALRAIVNTGEPNWSGVAASGHNRKAPGTPATICDIYIVEDGALKARGWNLAWLLRHELAHCNGWVGHAGGKKIWIGTPTAMPQLPESTRWLPAYPPLVCITSDRKIEPCTDRKATS